MRPEQIRAARGYLDSSRLDMAKLTGLSQETIKNLETGRFVPRPKTVEVLRDFFRSRGIDFFEVQGGLVGVVFDQKSNTHGPYLQKEAISTPKRDLGGDQG